MSRKDTIIIAVLVNAGLLIVLFASALKSHSSSDEFAVNNPPVIQETSDLAFKKEVISPAGDEVDVALNQFAQNSMASAHASMQTQEAIQPESNSSTPPLSPTNFAEDLKAIGIPETSPASLTQASQPLSQMVTMPQNKLTPEFTEIKVKKGDVLEKIARQHHTTVAAIMKTNQLTNTNLRIGQVLKIPNKAIKKAEPSPIVFSPQTPNTGLASASDAKYYTVKKGDSPWTIAVKNHLKVEELLKLNSMTEEQARRLKPGDKLRIQ